MHDYAAARRHLTDIGMPLNSWTNTVIVGEATARGITVEKRRHRKGLVLTHGGQQHRWHHGHSTLNSPLANYVSRYKDVSSRLLHNRGIAVPENCVFGAKEVDRAWLWAETLIPVVLKPHDGNQGRNVHVDIETQDEFYAAFAQVSGASSPVLVEQFHTGVEHRCLIVDNKLIAATQRRPASVLGDGQSSIRDLVSEKNETRGSTHKQLKLGAREREVLIKQHRLSPEDIPARGVRVYLRQTSNLHTGGDAIDATDDITADERAFIEQAARAVPGLRLSGMDVLLPRGSDNGQPVVIEINKSPMISMHHFPWEGSERDVAGAVLDAMFPATRVKT